MSGDQPHDTNLCRSDNVSCLSMHLSCYNEAEGSTINRWTHLVASKARYCFIVYLPAQCRRNSFQYLSCISTDGWPTTTSNARLRVMATLKRLGLDQKPSDESGAQLDCAPADGITQRKYVD